MSIMIKKTEENYKVYISEGQIDLSSDKFVINAVCNVTGSYIILHTPLNEKPCPFRTGYIK